MRYAGGMALKENDIRFFRPLWLRIALTAALAIWCALEIIFSHEQLWIGITGFGTAYCLWNFFWKWPKDLPPLAAAGTAPAPETIAPPADAPAAPAAEPPHQS
jgi:hypothetical protein